MNESTPFASQQSNGMNNNNGMDSISQMAQGVFTKEGMAQAGQFAKQKAAELHKQAQDGDHSLRFLALSGGLFMVVVAVMEVFDKMLHFNVVGALIEIYTFGIGIVVLLLEGKSQLLPLNLQTRLYHYALFLKFLWGRGCLYFIAGTLQLYQKDFWNMICGAYMCFIGALLVLVGWRTANKLRSMRKTLYSQQVLQQKFAQADIDGQGGLTLPQFRALTMSLALDLTRRETEAAFLHITNKSDDERLTYDAFNQWWTNTEVEENLDPNSFNFV